ncbi:hypothetical protein QUF80_04800 [Desulfococcaceae bacterium HSG8]|nr:hypothetical protein [Desulfococcaceae bacterium HSG8]
MRYKKPRAEHAISKEKFCISGGMGPLRYAEDSLELEILPMTVFAAVSPQKMRDRLVRIVGGNRDMSWAHSHFSGITRM